LIPLIFRGSRCHTLKVSTSSFRLCLDLEKLKEKKKYLEFFFLLFGLRKVKRKKNEEESRRKNLSYEEKIFLPNMRGK